MSLFQIVPWDNRGAGVTTMTTHGTSPKKDRRKGPDLWIRILKVLGVVSWFFMLLFLILLEIAKPEFESFFDRFYHLNLRTTWDLEVAQHLYQLMFIGLGISIIGLLIGSQRYRRKTDKPPSALILIGVISIAGVALYRIYFM